MMPQKDMVMGEKRKKERKSPKPLDPERLEELALAYVARFSTTASKLKSYLKRKLRERGWGNEDEPEVSALVERFVERGYVDDQSYAKMRRSSLLSRGYGARRIAQDLYAAGVDEAMRADQAPDEAEKRLAVVSLARRRRFGPFCAKEMDIKLRDKQLAAILRAGHGFDAARRAVDAESVADLEEWVAEAEEEANWS